ncbi:MAG: type II toxin-antitoxin system RelE/ParE family toxin [Bacteroidota bacterium]
MEIKVLWTDFAIIQLEQVFDYYKYKASHKVAKTIVTKIVDRTIVLENNPMIGAKEPLLENRSKEYRYLVEGNYKIIYSFDSNLIKICAVFDCRLNPIKMDSVQ